MMSFMDSGLRHAHRHCAALTACGSLPLGFWVWREAWLVRAARAFKRRLRGWWLSLFFSLRRRRKEAPNALTTVSRPWWVTSSSKSDG